MLNLMTLGFGFKYDESLAIFTMYTFQKDFQRLIGSLSENRERHAISQTN